MTDNRKLFSLLLVFLVENFGPLTENPCSVCGVIKRTASGNSEVVTIDEQPVCADCVFARIQRPGLTGPAEDPRNTKLWSLLLVFLSENFTSGPEACEVCGAEPVRFGKAFEISNEWVCADCIRARIIVARS